METIRDAMGNETNWDSIKDRFKNVTQMWRKGKQLDLGSIIDNCDTDEDE